MSGKSNPFLLRLGLTSLWKKNSQTIENSLYNRYILKLCIYHLKNQNIRILKSKINTNFILLYVYKQKYSTLFIFHYIKRLYKRNSTLIGITNNFGLHLFQVKSLFKVKVAFIKFNFKKYIFSFKLFVLQIKLSYVNEILHYLTSLNVLDFQKHFQYLLKLSNIFI